MLAIELTPEHPVSRIAALGERAEAAGFDTVFCSCHYNNRDPFLALDRVARRTDSVRLGPGVANPYETHPVTLAARIATLDEASDGRAVFEEHAAEAMARWAEFDRPLHTAPDSAFALEVRTNWKLAVENYCESYHLPWVHPGLNSYSRLEDHYHIEAPGAFSGQGTRVYRPMLAEDGRRFPLFGGLSETWDEGAEYIALYPNVLLGVHKDHTFAIVLEPVAVDRTVEHVTIFYTDAGVVGDDWAEMREKNAAMWKDVFVEDVFVVEGMQRGRHARGFDGGRFSPVMDSPTHCFHHWVATAMQQETPPATAAAE